MAAIIFVATSSTVFLLEASRAYVPNGDREVNEPGYIIEGRL